MIILNNPRGVPKKEYIESVIESCKVIFSKEIDDKLFRGDNLKIAFCTSENQADVYNAFCEQFFPLYLAEKYSRTNLFAAQAMTNMQTDTYGILICLDTEQEGLIWYRIILHEMSHIFCIVNELGGENYQDKYSPENLGQTEQAHCSNIGYAIWREFIADYIAMQINPLVEEIPLIHLRETIHLLDQSVDPDDTDRREAYTELLSCIFQDSQVLSVPCAEGVFQLMDNAEILSDTPKRKYYEKGIRLVFEQLRRKSYWEISVDYMVKLGSAYLETLQWELYEILAIE